MAKNKKLLTILAILVVVLSVAIPVLDTYVFKSEGFESLTFGLGIFLGMIVMPAAIIVALLYGAANITSKLASDKVNSSEKKDIIKRLLFVTGGILVFYGLTQIIRVLGIGS